MPCCMYAQATYTVVLRMFVYDYQIVSDILGQHNPEVKRVSW